MNLPTKLSVSRILLTFGLLAALLTPGLAAKLIALAVFIVASLTDWLDGMLARRRGELTPLGALLDPIADKVLVLGAFLAFVQLRLVPAWMVLVIMLRELVITGIRLIAANRQVVLAAAAEGKHKTVSQMATIVLVLGIVVAREALGAGLNPAADHAMMQAIIVAMWVTVGLTVVSGGSFFWRHRAVLRYVIGR